MVRNKLTTKEFIEKAKEKHGDTYDYNKTVYVSSKKKVIIVCKKDGVFEQTPNSHLAGVGCPKCGYEKLGIGKRGKQWKRKSNSLAAKRFFEKAASKFGDLFEYSDYVSSIAHMAIVCKKHGAFMQSPSCHIDSLYGCNKCASEFRTKNLRNPFYESPDKTLSLKERKSFILSKMRELKEQTPCMDCGKNYPHYVLDFDHVRGDKVDCLSELCAQAYSWEKIKAEMDKCDVVCSNCHRTRHWNNKTLGKKRLNNGL